MSSIEFDKVRLFNELQRWSLEDLQTLCFYLELGQPSLALSYDKLAGQTSPEKARSLIRHLQKYEGFQSWAHLRHTVEEHFTFMDATFLPELTQTPPPQLASKPDRPERVPDPKPAIQATLRQIPVWGWIGGGGVLAVIALLLIWPWGETPVNPTPTVAATQIAVVEVEEPPPHPTQELPPTVTPSPQPTAIVTPTVTPSPSPTNPPTATWTPTITPTPTPTHTATWTPTITPTSTPTATWTPTITPTPTPTATIDPNVPPSNAQLGDEWVRPKDGMMMVFVPAGTFMMGSTEQEIDDALAVCKQIYDSCNRSLFENEEYREVTLEGFWIDKYEVTNAQYQLCVDDGACEPSSRADDGNFNGANYPVVSMRWYDAEAYAEWVGAKLPTEEQWEYAARGEGRRIYPWGDTFDGTRLNCHNTRCPNDGYQYTAPVGSYPEGASWVGALDMAGNVLEWTNSPSDSNSVAFVLRGGSWIIDQHHVRASNRHWANRAVSYHYIGFRLVSPIFLSPEP